MNSYIICIQIYKHIPTWGCNSLFVFTKGLGGVVVPAMQLHHLVTQADVLDNPATSAIRAIIICATEAANIIVVKVIMTTTTTTTITIVVISFSLVAA